ncbi:MAG TPA: NepR family anti-sigma factor [Stellaceae bacterium]|nr:NepR family anti-sigma factor [Stellaceae bacterium]
MEDAEILAELLPVSVQIEHFLSGATNGRALLEALYDHVLEEPVPERLTSLLRR